MRRMGDFWELASSHLAACMCVLSFVSCFIYNEVSLSLAAEDSLQHISCSAEALW